MSDTKCARCDEQHDNWPDGTPTGMLCQGCWEKECSRLWWEALPFWATLGFVEEQP